jgi:hypothetical protein
MSRLNSSTHLAQWTVSSAPNEAAVAPHQEHQYVTIAITRACR